MQTNNKGLSDLAVFTELQKQAASPYDLTVSGALRPERVSSCICRASGLDVLYGTQRVDDAVLENLQKIADESNAVDQFLRMKKGEVINRIEGHDSENRMVLHTAMRDVFADQPYNLEATSKAREELDKLASFLDDLENGRIRNAKNETVTGLINIGIGGSDLGPRAVYLALEAYRLPERKVYFISNVDPDDAAEVLSKVDLSRTIVNVVSKSGTTLETLTNEEFVKVAYVKAGLDPARHFVAVTGKGSPMDNPEKYLRAFYMFDYVGGRYSVTSMVGAVMLGFALGLEAFMEFLKGANSMDIAAEHRQIKNNPALLLAVLGIWNRNFLGNHTLAILPYSQALVRFTAHLQQCDMESNGKSCARNGVRVSHDTGPIIWGEPGTNGQHAFYQLIHQGTTVVPVEFVGFRENQRQQDILINGTYSQEKLLANLLAQSMALATGKNSDNPNREFQGNRPNTIILGDKLDSFCMGALLALYEAKIVFQGFIWNINSFDQEGVQLGKVLANRLLDHFSGLRQDQDYNGEEDDPLGWAMMKAAGVLPGK
ncbi:MAG: glucose-6-phosphate isomerase [Proteobacteria bacterium]|nr:glucose-6-phosphate isomerase [Pseudomonadota bacterium]MBU1710698.1 glucose-6-phosphate isomerase [Pseudomonadota bacterium]